MKNKRILIVSLLGFLFGFLSFSQNESQTYNMFVRVYNMDGKKIAKGKIASIDDSSMVLKRNEKQIELMKENIGKIKTKRSGGHNVLMASLTGASIGAIVGLVTGESEPGILGYTPGEGALAFGTLGIIGGAAVGGVSAGIKESETFIINGEQQNWDNFLVRFRSHLKEN